MKSKKKNLFYIIVSYFTKFFSRKKKEKDTDTDDIYPLW